MTAFTQFLDTFKSCEQCRKILPSEMLQLGYTLYADRFSDFNYMIILQNPLFNQKRINLERDEAEKAKNLEERVKVHQKYFRHWFLKGERGTRKTQNLVFSQRFLGLLKHHGLINYTSIEKYLESDFFQDFYVTDIIKFWGKTRDIKKSHLQHSVLHLIEEMKGVKPRLIFSFSTRVWDSLIGPLESDFDLKPVQGWIYIRQRSDPNRLYKKVVNVHGYLFKGKFDNGRDFYLIPLVHLSSRIRNNLLRDTYFEFLREGLDLYLQM